MYHKYYDDVLILLKTGLRISELCGLTVAEHDFKNEVVIIDHQLVKRAKNRATILKRLRQKRSKASAIKQGNDTSISTGYEETPKGRTICDRRTGQLSICQSERQAQSCD